MTAAVTILERAKAAGVTLWGEEGTLRYRGDKVAVESLLPILKARKPELLEALRAPKQSDTEATEDLREHFEERAGILEYDAGLPRPEAEREAARITATYARNLGYSWASLRMAFEGYPELLATQLPEKDGPIDSLPLGVSKLAVLPGGRVVRQGVFTGPSVVTK